MKEVAGIILSAGSARRFGGDKLIQQLDGKPVIAHVVEAALGSDLAEVVIVVRPGDDALTSVLPRSSRLRVVPNPDHLEGISSSLRCGLQSLGPTIDSAVILLADEPEVTADRIGEVIQAFGVSEARALRTSYDGHLGHPVVLDRTLWPAVIAETGDVGARRILDRSEGVEVFESGTRVPIDVDTKEDLAALRRRLSRM